MRKLRRLPREEVAPYILELPPITGPVPTPWPRIDWATLFGNDHPVELEVGFGKGLFLNTAGAERPDTNFFGIEIERKYQMYAATRVARNKLTNVKTCCGDAKRFLVESVVPHSVSAVHVYFPDPWWKNRHKKRLLYTPEFAAHVHQVLKPGGVLYFVTDVADYFQMVTGIMAQATGYEEMPRPNENEPKHDMDYLTNFERKFRKEGRPIYRANYRTK